MGANLRREADKERRPLQKQFQFPSPHVQEFLIAANIALRFPSEGANDDTGQNKSEIHDGEKLLYVNVCFHGIKRGLRTQCSVSPFSCTLHHEECRKVRVRTVKLRIPQNLGPTYESYDCETFSVVLE